MMEKWYFVKIVLSCENKLSWEYLGRPHNSMNHALRTSDLACHFHFADRETGAWRKNNWLQASAFLSPLVTGWVSQEGDSKMELLVQESLTQGSLPVASPWSHIFSFQRPCLPVTFPLSFAIAPRTMPLLMRLKIKKLCVLQVGLQFKALCWKYSALKIDRLWLVNGSRDVEA